jgi:hypothetical protein
MDVYIDPVTEEAFLDIGFISGYVGSTKVSIPVTNSYTDKQEAKLIKLNTTLLKKQEGINKLNKDKVPKEVFDRLQGEIEGIQRDIQTINTGVEIVRYNAEDYKHIEVIEIAVEVARLERKVKDINRAIAPFY